MYLNNMLRPRHKMLSTLMLYSTTKCQSRCKHCSIWQKPVEHLSFKDIREIMRSKCISQHTVVGLEGGEFLLHPEADVIMEWFKENHPNYTLLSNCLNPQKVIDAVRKFHPAHLYVSLDGDKETYKSMRGCNGHDPYSDSWHFTPPFQWTVGTGVGLQYNFANNWGVYLEPTFSWHIPNGSTTYTIWTEHPFTITVPFGIRFTW